MPKEKSNRLSSGCSRCGKCWSSFTSLAFSTLGLIVAIVTYSVIGGLLFQRLEVNEETKNILEARKEVEKLKLEHFERLKAFIRSSEFGDMKINSDDNGSVLQSNNENNDHHTESNSSNNVNNTHSNNSNISIENDYSNSSNSVNDTKYDNDRSSVERNYSSNNNNRNNDTSAERKNNSNYINRTSDRNHSSDYTNYNISNSEHYVNKSNNSVNSYTNTSRNNNNVSSSDDSSRTNGIDDVKSDSRISASSSAMAVTDKKNWTEEALQLIESYHRSIYEKIKDKHWDGKYNQTAAIDHQWSFAGALLYAVSAITTIGYGHVTPKTTAGQVATIIYCIIGLPLTLMCVAKLGRAFAFAFRVIYHTCFCAICCLACIAKRKNGKAVIKKSVSDMNESLGALVNRQEVAEVGTKESNPNITWKVWKRTIGNKFNRSLRHDTAVPTYLCLIVMTAYIMGGAVLFSQWQKNWTVWEGAYFCFVTLTTIGFGDYVPGVGSGGKNNNQNLILCALYVLVGMAFIGMCIDLMQVDVVKKFKWIGQKLGLSKPKHAKTQSDKKKERVGLKLSSETLPQSPSAYSTHGSNHHPSLTQSFSNSLEVPSPVSIHSHTNTKRSISMPNTPSVGVKSPHLSTRPSGLVCTPIATIEEPESLEPVCNKNNCKKNDSTIPIKENGLV